jgi:hypothetical protein
MSEKGWNYFLFMVTVAIVTFAVVWFAHGQESNTWNAKAIIYDSANGIVLTHGTPKTGPVVFQSKKECENFLKSDEGKKVKGFVAENVIKHLPGSLVYWVCLPIVLGEKVD